jgi:hypothetical protein
LAPILLVTGVLPLWNRLRAFAAAQSLLAGANATVVGILLAALYPPIWTSGIDLSEELGSRPHPVCRFTNLEDSAVDPRPDRRGSRWNLSVRTCAKSKKDPQGTNLRTPLLSGTDNHSHLGKE